MPLAKAIKSFKGRYGHIRGGTTFNCEPSYFSALLKKGWVELAKNQPEPAPAQKPDPAPADNRDKGGAPNRAGKVEAGTANKPASKGQPASDRKGTEPRRGAGKAVTSRSLRQDLPSRETTPNSSAAGATNPQNPDESDPDAALP